MTHVTVSSFGGVIFWVGDSCIGRASLQIHTQRGSDDFQN